MGITDVKAKGSFGSGGGILSRRAKAPGSDRRITKASTGRPASTRFGFRPLPRKWCDVGLTGKRIIITGGAVDAFVFTLTQAGAKSANTAQMASLRDRFVSFRPSPRRRAGLEEGT